MDKRPAQRYVRGRSDTLRNEEKARNSAVRNSNSSEHGLTPPEPVADPRQRPPHQQRKRTDRDSWQSSTSPTTPETCQNDLCRRPEITIPDDVRSGPRGMTLCRRCYRRYKLEKKTAREEQRRVTDDWKKPRRKASRPREESSSRDLGRNRNDRNSKDRPTQRVESPQATRSPAPVPSTLATETPPNLDMRGSVLSAGSGSSYWTDLERASRRNDDTESNRPTGGRRGRSPAEKRPYSSVYDETEYYKYGRMEEDYDNEGGCCYCGCCFEWSRRRKWIVFGGSALLVILIIICTAVGVKLSHHSYQYAPSTAQVNNTLAFTSGGATTRNVNLTDDGSGPGRNVYTYYSGNASHFPPHTNWMSFDQMWTANIATIQNSCGRLQAGTDDTNSELQYIYDAIQDRANASLVDHRIILATVLQESKGCVHVGATTSSGGVNNPGLMQSHDGHAFNGDFPRLSILAMIQDGTQGTTSGDGLVQLLNVYGNPYEAMRGYNSGYVPKSGNLSEAAGATACYVSDMANRLTGWVDAPSTCPGE